MSCPCNFVFISLRCLHLLPSIGEFKDNVCNGALVSHPSLTTSQAVGPITGRQLQAQIPKPSWTGEKRLVCHHFLVAISHVSLFARRTCIILRNNAELDAFLGKEWVKRPQTIILCVPLLVVSDSTILNAVDIAICINLKVLDD